MWKGENNIGQPQISMLWNYTFDTFTDFVLLFVYCFTLSKVGLIKYMSGGQNFLTNVLYKKLHMLNKHVK